MESMNTLLPHVFRQPKLWPVQSRGDRRVTWLELFFDLIFVAAVDQIGVTLVHHYEWSGLFHYSFLFILLWSAWNGHTLFSTRFDADDAAQKLLTLVQCFIAAVMAANAREPLDSRDAAGFGAAYAAIRVVLVIQYLRVSRLPGVRRLASRFAAGFGLAAALWLASSLVPLTIRYVLWGMALIIDFVTPWFAEGPRLEHPPDASHFPERFGLFTIILMGEFVANVMRGIESQEYWSPIAAATAFGSMAAGFAIWWGYFEFAKAASHRHLRSKMDTVRFQVWKHAHLPLCVGIGVLGAGLELSIQIAGMGDLPMTALQIVFGSTSIIVGMIIAMKWTLGKL